MLKNLLIALCLLVSCIGCDLPTKAAPQPAAYAWESSGRHVLAFTIPGCKQCTLDKPKLRELVNAGVDVIEVDGTKHPELVRKYKSSNGYPEYVVLEDGQVKSRSFTVTALITSLKILLWIASVIF
jgi:hypothetical protein